MEATRSPAPWPRYPPRRCGHPHSACSDSRWSTHPAELRRLGYDPRELEERPYGCFLGAFFYHVVVAHDGRLASASASSVFAVAGCTTGSPRPLGAHHLLAGRSSKPL